jgi:hypothetical protein
MNEFEKFDRMMRQNRGIRFPTFSPDFKKKKPIDKSHKKINDRSKIDETSNYKDK